MLFKKVAILGPGLLGGSLLKALKEFGLTGGTAAWARRPEVRQACEEAPWCDEVYADAAAAAKAADLVVICTPVDTIVPLIEDIAQSVTEGCIVTDVGSTKSLICRQGHAVAGERARFVGSHPMAGSEKAGLEHAQTDLFQGRACLVTPLPHTCAEATEAVVKLWRRLEMEVTTLSPERHDEIVAHISHLPHMLASVLCSYLTARDTTWRSYAGNGLRDTTRIAAGEPGLWRSISRHNREEILRAIDGFEGELQQLKVALHNENFLEVEALLRRGKDYRDRLGSAG